MEKVIFGSDHAGLELKKVLIPFVQKLGYEVEDVGALEFSPEDDYPDFIIPVAKKVSEEKEVRGIILGGTGQGEAIAANRFKNVRAAVLYSSSHLNDIVRLSREHNDANILSLGARFLTEEEAKTAVEVWLKTPFSLEERHIRRIKKIDND